MSSGKLSDNAHHAIAEGEAIVARTREEYGYRLHHDDDDAGPLTQAWKRGEPALPMPLVSEALLPIIANAVEYERMGRAVAAALALTEVRKRYAELAPTDLASDEQTWTNFARKRIPLPAERIDQLIGHMAHRGGALRCTKCHAGTPAACSCGVAYCGEHRWASPIIPAKKVEAETALQRAAAAIAAHPEKSDRAIAADIGVSNQTVRRARQQMRDAGGDVTVDVTVADERIGRDGRRRRLPAVEPPPANAEPGERS